MNDFVSVRPADAAAWITVPTGDTSKYRRGVLGVATGSAAYPGAAVMGVDAAVHTGLGMVRYVGPDRATDFVLARRPEIVAGGGRVQAWLVGSGISAASLDELDATTRDGFARASEDGVPVVVDAGAIPLVDLGPLAVLTPHAGEAASLLGVSRDEVEGDPQGAALRAAERTGSVVLLKGADTHVVTPDGGVRLVASSATPWLAAAGAGDVLGGVLGALVAARAGTSEVGSEELAHLAAAAAVVHGVAARRASRGGPFPMTGLVEQLPGVVRDLAVRGDAQAD
ncbi:NAD(P)H-hydrate dehydratase [Curtobacterium sp. MCJR17_055]|uniref:ADP-dependent NAD(P)H-hydrate dehydratase n=1 Tax=unclassified Curtobacterium TaxID=257496 RepID=UPI000D8B7168|nr:MULTISPECIES: ADP/ATP-dependent (S)-NAD(P)H-hydrate dehydratase [unclassified Curtobacterium]PYY35263.1 NAD(P)H-hydrate dehydratase [Curtobacterium sp. MCBD17_029]PYY55453.1 NAD(P)H-hydrate dehydratase [Curtobacterium sp. MCJR17_055]PYY60201.1 NAD(P)H-hydrate dehydratase [Curtobacterium sp. MCPF17_015]WIB35164.1 NAD(P)H-hydrate dehydratase [Curtobacterium sp. MCJR17_043]